MPTQKVRRRLRKWRVKSQRKLRRRLGKLVWQKLTKIVRRRLGKTAKQKMKQEARRRLEMIV